MRMVDVFPAPFGPRKPKASPRCRSKSIAVHGDELAEALHEAAGMDERLSVVRGHDREKLSSPARRPGARARVASTSRRDLGDERLLRLEGALVP